MFDVRLCGFGHVGKTRGGAFQYVTSVKLTSEFSDDTKDKKKTRHIMTRYKDELAYL